MAVLEFAGCRATGGSEGLEGLKGGAKGSEPVQGSVLAPTGEESLGGAAGAAGVDVAGGGYGAQRQAWDGAPDGGLAAADPAMDAGDATSDSVSTAEKEQRQWCLAIVQGSKRRRRKVDAGWSAGLRAAIRLAMLDGNERDLVQDRAGPEETGR